MIEYPELELRNEDRLAAEVIGRTSSGLTTEIVQAQIRERQELLAMIAEGLDVPVCPELTNANPSAPHTVILEAQAWLLAQMAYRINQLPEQNLIAFANLFGIERRDAVPAETVLRFAVEPPDNTDVTIPLGTQVADTNGKIVFETTEAVVIPFGTPSADVPAQNIVTGHILLSPNVLTDMIDSVAFVESVTNPNAIDGGGEQESIDSVLSRVNKYQRRGERIVSAKDLEEAILDEALDGNGIVRAFPFVADGQFTGNRQAGHTTVVAMTRTGDALDADSKDKIYLLFDQIIGSQFVYLVDPIFIEFNVSVSVILTQSQQQSSIVSAIDQNLRNFYSPSREQFGRPILRSEIIAIIEGTNGVDRISAGLNSPILASPTADFKLRAWELPKLVNVSINVVG